MSRVLRPLLILAALLVVAPAAGAQQVQPRVIAGDDAEPGDHPHQVLLEIDNQFACGGSILDPTHIVTAAHCVIDDQDFYPRILAPGELRFRHGGVNRPGGGDGTDLMLGPAIQTVSVDRRYLRDDGSRYDSAVLTLASPLTATANTAPIALATAAEIAAASQATVSGWGQTQDGNPNSLSNILQEANVPLRSDSTCQGVYPNAYESSVMICAGGFSSAPSPPTQDTCQGDSGGPLSVNVSGTLKLAGLTSFGSACGRAPGVYTELNEAATRAFVTDTSQVGPPSTSARPTVSGTARVGAQVRCNPPAGGTPSRYSWFAVTSGGATELGPSSQVITVPASASGARLICDARLENDGGFFYAEADLAAGFGPIAAASGGGGSAGGGSGAGSGSGGTPGATQSRLLSNIGFGGFPGRRTSLRRVLRRGLAGRVSCDTDCGFRAELVLPRRSARKARIRGRLAIVSRVRSRDAAGGSGRRIRFRFSRRTARKLRRLTRGTTIEVRVTAADSSGTRRVEKKRLRLRR